jgi:hypothetical protein
MASIIYILYMIVFCGVFLFHLNTNLIRAALQLDESNKDQKSQKEEDEDDYSFFDEFTYRIRAYTDERRSLYAPVFYYVTLPTIAQLIKTVNQDEWMQNPRLVLDQFDAMNQKAAVEIEMAKFAGRSLDYLIVKKPNFQNFVKMFHLIEPYVSRRRYKKLYRVFYRTYSRAKVNYIS